MNWPLKEVPDVSGGDCPISWGNCSRCGDRSVRQCEKVRKTNDCVEPIVLDVGTGCEKV